MKRMIIRIALVLALSLVVTPIAISQQEQTVSRAKTYTCSAKSFNKKWTKLKYGQSLKKVKKIIGKSLGKSTVTGKNGKKTFKSYTLSFYITGVRTLGVQAEHRHRNDIYLTFLDGKLFSWGNKQIHFIEGEEEPPITVFY